MADFFWLRPLQRSYTRCSLGSILGNISPGTVFLDTLPGENIRHTSSRGKYRFKQYKQSIIQTLPELSLQTVVLRRRRETRIHLLPWKNLYFPACYVMLRERPYTLERRDVLEIHPPRTSGCKTPALQKSFGHRGMYFPIPPLDIVRIQCSGLTASMSWVWSLFIWRWQIALASSGRIHHQQKGEFDDKQEMTSTFGNDAECFVPTLLTPASFDHHFRSIRLSVELYLKIHFGHICRIWGAQRPIANDRIKLILFQGTQVLRYGSSFIVRSSTSSAAAPLGATDLTGSEPDRRGRDVIIFAFICQSYTLLPWINVRGCSHIMSAPPPQKKKKNIARNYSVHNLSCLCS